MSHPHDLPTPPICPDHTLEETIAHWENQLGYNSEAERALIANLAAARVRIQRCRDSETADLDVCVKKELHKEWDRRLARVRKTARSLAARPAEIHFQLEATPDGRDWLARRWRELHAALRQGIPLPADQVARAMNVMGYFGAAPGPDAPDECRQLWANLLQAAHPDLRYHAPPDDFQAHCLDGFIPPEHVPADEAAARAWLCDLAADEQARLARLQADYEARARTDPELAGNLLLDARSQIARARVAATDPEAIARRRVEREADVSYARNLALLMRLRNGRQREREWELKEARRQAPGQKVEPKRAHPANSIDATYDEETISAPSLSTELLRSSREPTPPTTEPPPRRAPLPTAPQGHDGAATDYAWSETPTRRPPAPDPRSASPHDGEPQGERRGVSPPSPPSR